MTVMLNPEASTGNANYTDASPTWAVLAPFLLCVTFFHVSYAYILNDVSKRVPKPHCPEHTPPAVAASERRTTLKRDTEMLHKYDNLEWYQRWRATAADEWQAFSTRVLESGLWITVWEYLTFPTYRMHHFIDAEQLPQYQSTRLMATGRSRRQTRTTVGRDMDAQEWDRQLADGERWWQHLAWWLRVWLFIGGVIAFTLYICFLANLCLEFVMKCITGYPTGVFLGLPFLFFIFQVFGYLIRRGYEAVLLLWYNTGDNYNITAAFVWRFSLMLTALIFAHIEANSGQQNQSRGISDELFAQIFLRNMVVIGMWWMVGFHLHVWAINAHLVYKMRFEQEPSYRLFLPPEIAVFSTMLWYDVVSNVQPKDSEDTRKKKRIAMSFTVLLSLICFILAAALGKPIYSFVAMITIMYYLIMFGRRFKWKAIFVLWGGRHPLLNYFGHVAMCKEANVEAIDLITAKHTYEIPPGYVTAANKKYKSSGLTDFLSTATGAITGWSPSLRLSGWSKTSVKRAHDSTIRITAVRQKSADTPELANQSSATSSSSSRDSLADSAPVEADFVSTVTPLPEAADTDSVIIVQKPKETSALGEHIELAVVSSTAAAPVTETVPLSGGGGALVRGSQKQKLFRLLSPAKEAGHEIIDSESGMLDLESKSEDAAETGIEGQIEEEEDVGEELPPWLDRFLQGGELDTATLPWIEHWLTVKTSTKDSLGLAVMSRRWNECCSLFLLILIVSLPVAISVLVTSEGKRLTNIDTKKAESKLKAVYPMCLMQNQFGQENASLASATDWDADNHTLNYSSTGLSSMNAVDLLWLCKPPYEMEKEKDNVEFRLKRMMMNWFGHDVFNTTWNFSSLHLRQRKPLFWGMDSLDSQSTLVSVRGTEDIAEVSQDLSIYSEVMILQVVSWILPLTNILPLGFLRDWVYYASLPSKGMISPKSRERFDKPVFEYVENKYKENKDRTILILGHSLGGSISQIVAARMAQKHKTKRIFSFSLSGPGTSYASQKFGYNVEDLDKTSMNLYARRDPIAKGDLHAGMIQIVECDASQSLICHTFARVFCEVVYTCKEQTRNTTFTDCYCEHGGIEDFARCNGIPD